MSIMDVAFSILSTPARTLLPVVFGAVVAAYPVVVCFLHTSSIFQHRSRYQYCRENKRKRREFLWEIAAFLFRLENDKLSSPIYKVYITKMDYHLMTSYSLAQAKMQLHSCTFSIQFSIANYTAFFECQNPSKSCPFEVGRNAWPCTFLHFDKSC